VVIRSIYQALENMGFKTDNLLDRFFDTAIGNVPFGSFKVPDKRYDKHTFLIHDYFFARTLDKVRPGGIIAFVTSKGTMGKENPSVRKYIAQQSDLLGAIRLPNNTFKSTAGTELTSDILFLQKRDTLTCEELAWVQLNTDENKLKKISTLSTTRKWRWGKCGMSAAPMGRKQPACPMRGKTWAKNLPPPSRTSKAPSPSM